MARVRDLLKTTLEEEVERPRRRKAEKRLEITARKAAVLQQIEADKAERRARRAEGRV